MTKQIFYNYVLLRKYILVSNQNHFMDGEGKLYPTTLHLNPSRPYFI
jgi:hypothetical protein